MNKKTLLVIFIAFGISATLAFISTTFLYGGLGNLAKNLKSMPNPKSKEVSLPREKIRSEIKDEFSAVEQETGLTNSGSEFLDECYKGQNNWKVHQGFAHRCSYRITQYYGFNPDFKIQMLNYFKNLAFLGWDIDNPSHSNMITMTDRFYRNVPAGSAQNAYLNGGTIVKKGSLEMHLHYQDTRYLLDSLSNYQNVMLRATLFKTFSDKRLVNVGAIADAISKNNQYLLVISIEKDYFEN